MITSIELQVISKILTTEDESEIDTLLGFDTSYYSVFKPHIQFIFDHRQTYGSVPDIFTFQAEFPDITLVTVTEPLTYLTQEMRKNKEHIMLIETFNKLKDLGSGDITEAWQYLASQCEKVSELSDTRPMDIVKDAKLRSDQIVEFNKQARIPTGFPEIDKLMYGGFSTVEELVLIVARTNSGKSWLCTKMMESAQKHGFPVLYYSPEMQASYLGTRFDTWRAHFQNSQLHQGKYDANYIDYIQNLMKEDTSAFVLEDKDMPSNEVNVPGLEQLVKKHKIKMLIIDGLSYMADVKKSDTDYVKYKNICASLFKLSKQYGCVVIIAMQANRETKECKDDKGAPMPSLYEVEGSDHPGRIATQAFSVRQIFDKHVLDIRLEKSRTANNSKPILSYAWDINTGNMQYLPGDDDATNSVLKPVIQMPNLTTHTSGDAAQNDMPWDDSEFEDVEF